MSDPDPQIFRWLLLLVLLLNGTISGYYRRRARSEETIPRSAESLRLRLARVLISLPGLLLILAFLIHPSWIAWSSLAVPAWVRWIGVLVGLAVAPLNVWMLRSLGKNISETVLTKQSHELMRTGPYRWLRHPLYSFGLLMLGALSLVAANWLMAALTLAALVFFSFVIIPREEAELVKKFGRRYEEYRRDTGRLLPRFGPPLGGREEGGVDGGRGGCRSGPSVSRPFGCECLTVLTLTPFPAASHRTVLAVLPHTAPGLASRRGIRGSTSSIPVLPDIEDCS